jgi:hypothetical protein
MVNWLDVLLLPAKEYCDGVETCRVVGNVIFERRTDDAKAR